MSSVMHLNETFFYIKAKAIFTSVIIDINPFQHLELIDEASGQAKSFTIGTKAYCSKSNTS